MFQQLKNKFEAKRAVWSQETQQRMTEYAELERKTALLEMKRNEKMQSLVNTEVEKYLRTVHPTFLLKPDVSRALLNMLHARSEGTVSININMTKEMRKAYSFYHSELKIFLNLLERKGYVIEGSEETFLNTFLTKLRENNYRLCLDIYGDFVPEGATLFEAFDRYFDIVEDDYKYESGNVDFFASYLNQKNIDFSWTKGRLKRKLKQYEKANKHEFKLKQLERRLREIS
ncbi:hypothetical protein CR194_11795 [Salipaludibacillus keqinensis]|uniref:Uncharacterized protein n=1 Tax=Salipaludibacillus keqinensis TaxID=2045207 RepID=A0A323TG56_9BACI|nr:hypothetical protein [Salipaludibacillus keqinensis]PYZ93821.1 hypothetical protein CR194_11795 [Salipaludibacillus keqinensis]